MSTSTLCPICGETAPEPAWICLYRRTGAAQSGRPCEHSREGAARAAADLEADEVAHGVPADDGGER